MRVMIAVPCLDYSRSEFMEALVNLVKRLASDGVGFEFRKAQSTLVYFGRDELAREAMGAQFDYMLWLDSDMVFPENVFSTLMNGMEKTGAALVTGIYRGRRYPFKKLVYRLVSQFQGIPYGEELPGELFPIEGCGFGCVLVDVKAIAEVHKRFNAVFAPTGALSEDLAFCYRLKELGYQMYAEPSIKCSHIGSIAITCDSAEKLMDYIKER